MNLLRKLIPDVLRDLDLRLLRERPRLWATRLPYHLWFLLLVNAVIFVLGVLLPVNAQRSPEPEELFGYMLVPMFVYLAFWVYRIVLFTPERRFGVRRPYAEVGELLVHVASLLLIISIPYTLALTVAWRIGNVTPDDEFVAEVDALNEQAAWFYGSVQHPEHDDEEATYYYDPYSADLEVLANNVSGRRTLGSGTHRFYRSLKEYSERLDEVARAKQHDEELHDIYKGYLTRANLAANVEDTAEFDADTAAFYYARADSIERNFPLLYTEHGSYTPSDLHHEGPVSDSLLEVAYLERYRSNAPMDPAAIARVLAIGTKYTRAVHNIGTEKVKAEFAARETSTSGIRNAQPRMDDIAEAKALDYFFTEWKEMWTALVIIAFVLALLLSVFKNLYWQPFLIMLVVAGILPVVLLILAEILEHGITPWDDDDILIYTWWCIGAFTIVRLFTVTRMTAYRSARAVITIIGNLVLPFFALFTLAILHIELDVFGLDVLWEHVQQLQSTLPVDDPALVAAWSAYHALDEKIEWAMWLTLWGGMVLYAFAFHPLLRNLYTRLMALPERR